MTILPKKKSSGATKGESEAAESSGHLGHGHHAAINNVLAHGHHNHIIGQDASRERLVFSSARERDRERERERDEKPLSDEGTGAVAGAGPSSHSKRRHRASPHRSVRKHRGASSVPGGALPAATSSGVSSQMPSTSQAAGGIIIGEEANDRGTIGPLVPTAQDAHKSQGSGVNTEEAATGYNSSDEYGSGSATVNNRSEEDWAEREVGFEKKLRKQGLVIKQMGEDGACLFRAVADQVYGDQEMHSTVRKHCMDYMAKNSDYFSQYVTEEFESYIERKRLDHIHGNHVEMQALSEMYNRTLEVYHYSAEPINIFQSMHSTDNEPIRLSYHKNIHYNSIVNPYKATVGVGLGLPGFVPGLAEKNLLGDAVRQSEDLHIEQAMLEDKLKATDWEATNEAIEEQVARESYLEWLRDNERRARKQSSTRTATATCSSSASMSSPGNHSPRNRGLGSPSASSPREDKSAAGCEEYGPSSSSSATCGKEIFGENLMMAGQRCMGAGLENSCKGSGASPKSDFTLLETASFMNQMPPDVFGLSEWEDADILAQVLAASQQEYLDSLKRSAMSSLPNCSAANSGNASSSLSFSSGASSSFAAYGNAAQLAEAKAGKSAAVDNPLSLSSS